VLRYLVDNPGRLITHDELLDALWPDTYVQPQVLRTYVLDLRRILGDDPAQPLFIQTLPKRGYCFVASVTEEAESHAASAPRVPIAPLPAPRIVGRELELADLEAHVERVAAGQRRLVFITGEAGIGKTALVDAFCQRVNASACIAQGQCVEGLGPREEYYPITDALCHLCSSSSGEKVRAALSALAPAWSCPPRREPATSDHHPTRERMPSDLCAALEELAFQEPLILIIEDVHWADAPTLHLLSALARRRGPAKLMIVATYRPHDAATLAPLKSVKQDLLMRRLCVELPLPPLSGVAVSQLISRELKQEVLPLGLATFVHRHSEGNPLFAIAILEHLIAQGFLLREDGSAAPLWKHRAPGTDLTDVEAQVPEGLAQMIELEIERLTPQEQQLLEAGSLLNVAFPAWAVAAALDQDAAAIEDACDQLAHRLYFLERAGQDDLPDGSSSAFYVFAHGLYREVLYQRQSAASRARRHIRIAQRLGALFAGREFSVAREMALHYEAAGDWQRAVKSLRNASTHAAQRGALTEAAEMLHRALAIVQNNPAAGHESALQEIHFDLVRAQHALSSTKQVPPQNLDVFSTGT
jgi:predicted ATPase